MGHPLEEWDRLSDIQRERCAELDKLRAEVAKLKTLQPTWQDYPAITPPVMMPCMAKDEDGRVWRGEYYPATRGTPYWIVDGGDWLEEQPVIVAWMEVPK